MMRAARAFVGADRGALNALQQSLTLHPATYAAPVRVLPGGKRANTHLARMHLPNLPMACVKAFPISAGDALFNEVAGLVLARAAGLASPGGGIIALPVATLHSVFSASLPAPAQYHEDNGLVVCFVSQPISDGYGSMAVGLRSHSKMMAAIIAARLCAWTEFPRCLAFDQWVGNWDRHDENVLVGPAGRLCPIDHSDCFLGPNWTAELLETPDFWATMKLIATLGAPSTWPAALKSAVLMECDRWVGVYSAAHEDILQLREWVADAAGYRWMHWLWKRSELTRSLWADRLGMI
jgi:hypothetical protein